MQMSLYHSEHGGCLVVMDDKFRPGRYASGVTPSRDVRMQFVGGFSSYADALQDGRRRYKNARSTYLRKQRRNI